MPAKWSIEFIQNPAKWVTLNFYPKLRNYWLISLTSEASYWTWHHSASSRFFALHSSRPLVLLIAQRKPKELVLSWRSVAHDMSQVIDESCGLSNSRYRHVSRERCANDFQGSWILIGVRPRGSSTYQIFTGILLSPDCGVYAFMSRRKIRSLINVLSIDDVLFFVLTLRFKTMSWQTWKMDAIVTC